MFFADGYQGQRVYIFPTKNLVIVRMGLAENADENIKKTATILKKNNLTISFLTNNIINRAFVV